MKMTEIQTNNFDEIGAAATLYLSIASWIIGAAILLGMLIKGIAWMAEHVFPLAQLLGMVTVTVGIPLGLLLLISRRSRPYGGVLIFTASYGVGLNLWISSFMAVYLLSGIFWMIVGFLFAGLGVIPIAIITTMINKQWSMFLWISFVSIVVYALREAGIYLMLKGNPE